MPNHDSVRQLIKVAGNEVEVAAVDPQGIRAEAKRRQSAQRKMTWGGVVVATAVAIVAAATMLSSGSPATSHRSASARLGTGPGCGPAVSVSVVGASASSGAPSISSTSNVTVTAVLRVLRPVTVQSYTLILGTPNSVSAVGESASSLRNSAANPANQVTSNTLANVTASDGTDLAISSTKVDPGSYPLFAAVRYSDLGSCNGVQDSDGQVMSKIAIVEVS